MAKTIVLYPLPVIGHLISMVELGKLIHSHHPSLSITILVTTAPLPFSITEYLHQVTSTSPSIIFHYLPAITLPPPDAASTDASFEALAFRLLYHSNGDVQNALETISRTSTIKGLIIDFFCDPVFDVSYALGVPTYYFFTTCAFGLALLLHLPFLHRTTSLSFKDLEHDICVPGIPPFPALDSPSPLLDRTREAYDNFLRMSVNMARSHGIIVNSFEMFESRAVKALNEGLPTADGPTPPVYCIGPMIGTSSTDVDTSGCLDWLSSQPSRSVVFLCFGSMGSFSKAQIVEIAVGLERSGSRFLWVVRSPPGEDDELGRDGPDLEVLLPNGFLLRTKDRGLVVKSWAPQKEVLSHDSVGGFVTHCGWNSVLESVVCGGVPMIGWPLYAEQRFNRVFLVEEIKVALPLEMSPDNGFVTAEEVTKRVRELMEPESVAGKVVREQVAAMRDGAMAAMGAGGSSRADLDKLAHSWM